MNDLDSRVHLLLRAGGHTVATAESLTGGRLAVHFTDTPGASATYLGGVVTYATELKSSVLDVPSDVIEEHGVVSAACARAMASGVRELTGSTFGVSTTGVAGPDEQEGKTARHGVRRDQSARGCSRSSSSASRATGRRSRRAAARRRWRLLPRSS